MLCINKRIDLQNMNTHNNAQTTRSHTPSQKTEGHVPATKKPFRGNSNKGNKRRRNNHRSTPNAVHHQRTGVKSSQKKPTMPELAPGDIRVIPLGGVEQVGQNMNIIETNDDIFIVDIGIQFSSETETPGVDYIIPNIKYLLDRKEKIRGVFVTHGHLDHIGAFPYIIDQLDYPKVYCALLTKWMIDKRNSEFPHLKKLDYEVVKAGDRITVGNNIKVQIFHVTHSIPDAIGFSFETPQGNIILAGDTKLNHREGIVAQVEIDAYTKLSRPGQENLLFLSDSTGAEQPGWSKNEDDIIENIIELIAESKSRVFLGTFASQIARITRIIEGAHKYGKKVVLEGRSMKNNVDICLKSGIWTPPKGVFVSPDEAQALPPDKVVYLLTGSQGEEFAALMRISTKKHPKIKFNERDTVILSSSVIPGNDGSVRKLKDNLSRHGLRIVQYQTSDVHASGHGNLGELLWIQKSVGAKFFMPVHGYHSMLRAHAQSVIEENGLKKEHVIIPDNGSIIDINKEKFTVHKQKAPNNISVVEGFRVGDIQDVVVRDRKTLTKEGIFVVIASIDPKSGKMRKSPDIISRGFVYLRDSQELIQGARNIIKQSITKNAKGENPVDFELVKKRLVDDLSRYLVQNTGKRPIVIPVVLGL